MNNRLYLDSLTESAKYLKPAVGLFEPTNSSYTEPATNSDKIIIRQLNTVIQLLLNTQSDLSARISELEERLKSLEKGKKVSLSQGEIDSLSAQLSILLFLRKVILLNLSLIEFILIISLTHFLLIYKDEFCT